MGIRCFIAIELPAELKSAIDRTILKFKAVNADVRWVPVNNMHLTIKFLGDTDEKIIPAIKDSLSGSLAFESQFRIGISGMGVFPNIKNPRVIWLGTRPSNESANELKKIYRIIETVAEGHGFKMGKRDFSPHLTIGRFRSLKGREAIIRELEGLRNIELGDIPVEKISFIKSDLKPTGPVYTTLFEIPLKK